MIRTSCTRLSISLAVAVAMAGCQDAERITHPQLEATANLSTMSATAAPFAYVANNGSSTVSVIATATNTVVATIGVGTGPRGVAITPDG